MEAAALSATTVREEPIGYLFRESYARMVRLAFLMTSDNALAEEIVQEAFVKVWKNWSRIRSEGSSQAYLRAAVLNQSRSSLRRRFLESRKKPPYEPVAADQEASRRVDVGRALLCLPPRQRACVILRYYEDMTEKQCAQILRVSVGTIKSQTYKALRRLETEIGGGPDGIR